MIIPWGIRNIRGLTAAAVFGTATALFFATGAMFLPQIDPSSDTQGLQWSVPVSADASASAFLPVTAAGMNLALAQKTPVPVFMSTDSRSDNYQLERDSCCIGSASFPEAAAATPSAVAQIRRNPDITGNDSSSDNYRLERISCCAGN